MSKLQSISRAIKLLQKAGFSIFKFFYVTLLIVFFTKIAVAQQVDPAQQALEQLRMLQQRLAAERDTQQAPAAAAPAQAAPAQVRPLPPQAPPQPTAAQTRPPAQPAQQPPEAMVPPAVEKETIDELAFEEVTGQLFPLSPEQIIKLKQMYQTKEYAEASPAGTPPKPTATSQIVNLSPGSTPPVIRLAQGFVSSLVFLDSTGSPWPISAYDLGNPSAFSIQWDKTSNTLMIQALKLYTYGNLAVRLQGLNTPVMLTLIPGQKAVDYRVDLRIQGFGPNAKSLPMEVGLPPSANDVLLNVLDGVPPPASKRLTVSGGDARAWLLNEKMYVRTNLTILSPGWIASMTSADGMHAYEMQKSPVLLVSWHGKVMQLKVEGL
ncbi:DotH/IcmK family type IV secretion protein [Legionella londiniensis]|uniref:IcmK protein n=1 Tax=Legionella londiniensis TaxID=45068 RepID=A0A0W0VLS3_9GAMM|nr:DotH/IcmK family type IV secretion protein [Legionella londiniensis]KTD21063.1 IcmK protein [Legionella londiniensis]STX93639.1 IcmK protein [Legionella londiniensis]